MFNFFKGKEKGNVLYAPCKGKVVPLTEVPDPTFSEKLLGDGFAVIPRLCQTICLRAHLPCMRTIQEK